MSSKLLISIDGPGTVELYDLVSAQTPITADQLVLPTDTISAALSTSLPTAKQSAAQTVAMVENAPVSDGPIARLFRRFVINHVASQTGRDPADVKDAVAKVEATSGRPILDWLTSGGLQELISLILQALALFANSKAA